MTTYTPAHVPYSPLPVSKISDVNGELDRIQRQQTGLFQPRLIVYGMGGNPSPYVVRATDWLILVDATGGAITITFPDAARLDGLAVKVVKIDSSANAVTLGATISGVVNPTLATKYAEMIIDAGQGVWYGAYTVPTPPTFYKEGPWTPANPNVTLTSNVQAIFTKIGREVFFQFDVTWATTADTNNAIITGLPFTVANGTTGGVIGFSDYATAVLLQVDNATTTLELLALGGSNITNATVSGKRFIGNGSYTAAT